MSKPEPIPHVYDCHKVIDWLEATGRQKWARRLHDYLFDGHTNNGVLRGFPFECREDWDEHYDPRDVELFKLIETEFPQSVQLRVWW